MMKQVIFNQLTCDILLLLCGSPYFDVSPTNLPAPNRTICFRSSRKSPSQSRALPLTLIRRLKISFSLWWSSVLKAPTWPWSMAISMLFMIKMTAVSVEWNGQYSDWKTGGSSCTIVWLESLASTIISAIFERKLRFENLGYSRSAPASLKWAIYYT